MKIEKKCAVCRKKSKTDLIKYSLTGRDVWLHSECLMASPIDASTEKIVVYYKKENKFSKVSFKRSYAGDVGFDLEVANNTILLPNNYTKVPSNVRIQLPDSYYARIEPRSSASKQGIHVFTGIIDSGFRGQLYACCWNLTDQPISVKKGDRICQIICHKRVLPYMVEVDELEDSERGEGGFGSSNNKDGAQWKE